jgi:RNA polymerase sigma factor (sigma-70 family)
MTRPRDPTQPLTVRQKFLVQKNRGLVYVIVRTVYRLNWIAHAYGTEEDVLQDGMIALCNSARRYNPKVGVKFSTYATIAIRHEIHKRFAEAGMVHIPDYARSPKSKYYLNARNALVVSTLSGTHPLYASPEPDAFVSDDCRDALALLPPRLRIVLVKLFGFDGKGGMTLSALGREQHLCRERIRELREEGLKLLRPAFDSIDAI